MRILNKISFLPNKKRQWISISISVVIAGLLTIWGIYGIGEYGIAIFILTPFFLGFSPAILYGYKNTVSLNDCRKVSFLSITIFMAFLLVFAIEGLICIIMALPIGLICTWLGSLIAYEVVKKNIQKGGPAAMLILIFIIPSFSFIENKINPRLNSVVSSIEIKVSPETVWKNVVEFPPLNKPTELIFKTGIAYPINAKIEGQGVGAIRYCNFTTGSFVEPITKWDKPNLLAFDVKEQPAPMKELSFWDIDAPHLHDYFVSKKGQFKLLKLKNGNTKLIGTTWYYNDIKPNFYWNIWSSTIIHKIHYRVLNHIKWTSEKMNIKK